MEASLASSEASAAAVTAPRRALATLVSTSSGVKTASARTIWLETLRSAARSAGGSGPCGRRSGRARGGAGLPLQLPQDAAEYA